jgi:RNAse (barnase) inhibitor barstar
MTQEYVLDGSRIASLESFYDEISRVLVPGDDWGRNLDALDEILNGGFGAPAEPFTLKWSNSAVSKAKLGYPETVRQLEFRLELCHPSNREDILRKLAQARSACGPTVFDWLVEIIGDHGGSVHLVLD